MNLFGIILCTAIISFCLFGAIIVTLEESLDYDIAKVFAFIISIGQGGMLISALSSPTFDAHMVDLYKQGYAAPFIKSELKQQAIIERDIERVDLLIQAKELEKTLNY